MKYSLFIMLLASLIIACNSNKEKVTTTITDPVPIPDPISECYHYATPNDTIKLKLIHVGESITGTLVYKLHEKDKNVGTIQGSMHGDTLIANYTFISEGIRSVRQVAFKKEGQSFSEGHGIQIAYNDRFIFKHIDSLQFDDPFRLTMIDCVN